MYKITCDGVPILNTRHEDYIVFDPKVNIETNTVGECTFKIYTDHPHYNDLHSLKSVFEVSDENGVIFRGRMTNNTRDFYNGKAVDLEGSMAFFNDSMVKPFVFPDDFSSAATNSDNIVEYFLNWLIHQHNQQVQPFQRFKLGNVTVTDPNNYISRSSEDIAPTWQILKDKLFESSLGGYLCIRYEDDGNYIDYLADFVDVNTQEIRLGENLFDVKYETDATATYSAIIPIGADIEVESEDGETTTKKLTLESIEDGKLNNADDTYKVTLDNGLHAIYSESAVENYGWICCPVEDSTWDDVTDANNLKNKARNYLLGTARYLADNIEVTAADLHFTDAEIMSFRLYKNVKVVSKPHGIEDQYKLTRLEIDLLNPQNTKIVIGTVKKTLTDKIVNKVTGTTRYVHIKYSDDGGLTFTANNGTTAGQYIGIYTDDKQEASDDLSKYTWTKIQGDDANVTAPNIAGALGYTPTSEADVDKKISEHNSSSTAHGDIRTLISELTTRLNTLADSDDETLDQMSELVAYIKSNRTLIEEVTTKKVNVSDIIDNLTTSASDKPLSAAQGVVLNGLIDALDEAKADKATTLAGYGITDGATIDELNNLQTKHNNDISELETKHNEDVNALQTGLDNHIADEVSHITADERTYWNSKAEGEHTHLWEDVTDRPFSSTLETVELFANEIFTNETVELKGVYYRHYFAEWLNVKFFDFINYTLVVNDVEYTDYTVSDTSTIVFNDVAIGGRTTNLAVDGSEIRFIKLTYDAYELDVSLYANVHKIEKMHLPDDIGSVTSWNDIEDKPFGEEITVYDNTLTWDGDTEGKEVAVNALDSSFSYVHVSSAIPTLEDLQNGGSWATTGDDGIEYEESFTSENIADSDTLINCFDGYVLIAKEDGASFVDEYTNCTLPSAGIYFIYFGADGYTSKLTITDYTGFPDTEVQKLPFKYLSDHAHDWYGKTIEGVGTIQSDDIIYDGLVKVSDVVPTEEELNRGGTIRFYSVVDGKLSGDLISENYLKSPCSIIYQNGETLIASDGIVMVQIKADGVYFRQDEYNCVHSLTINKYTGFPYYPETIPAELLPTDAIKDLILEVLTEKGLIS